MRDVCAFISLAAVGDWREIGRIRFEQNSVERNTRVEYGGECAFLKCHDATNAKIETFEGKQFARFFDRSAEAMENAARYLRDILFSKRGNNILMSIARMNHQWFAEKSVGLTNSANHFYLFLASALIPIQVDTHFAHSAVAIGYSVEQLLHLLHQRPRISRKLLWL